MQTSQINDIHKENKHENNNMKGGREKREGKERWKLKGLNSYRLR
jgi:hypothetical protein